jgi:hypothetical protein
VLERDYPYNLITRNCVSEIFREVDVALGRAAQSKDEAVIREESIRRLGGHVAMVGSLNFVPGISALVVEDTYVGGRPAPFRLVSRASAGRDAS